MTSAERITRANDILMRGAYRRYLRERGLEAEEPTRAHEGHDAHADIQGRQPKTHGPTRPGSIRDLDVLP